LDIGLTAAVPISNDWKGTLSAGFSHVRIRGDISTKTRGAYTEVGLDARLSDRARWFGGLSYRFLDLDRPALHADLGGFGLVSGILLEW